MDFFSHNVDCGRLTENAFIVTLAETNEEEALGIATDIAQKISQEVFDIDNETFSLTVAIGGILLNENVPSIEHALARACSIEGTFSLSNMPPMATVKEKVSLSISNTSWLIFCAISVAIPNASSSLVSAKVTIKAFSVRRPQSTL